MNLGPIHANLYTPLFVIRYLTGKKNSPSAKKRMMKYAVRTKGSWMKTHPPASAVTTAETAMTERYGLSDLNRCTRHSSTVASLASSGFCFTGSSTLFFLFGLRDWFGFLRFQNFSPLQFAFYGVPEQILIVIVRDGYRQPAVFLGGRVQKSN